MGKLKPELIRCSKLAKTMHSADLCEIPLTSLDEEGGVVSKLHSWWKKVRYLSFFWIQCMSITYSSVHVAATSE